MNRKTAGAIYEELLRPHQPVHIQRGALAALLGLDQDGGEQRMVGVLHSGVRAEAELAIKKISEAIKTKK